MTETSGYMTGFDANVVGTLAPNYQWLPMTVLVSFIIIILHGTLLGIAHAFSVQDLKRHAKAEIVNAFATLLIAIFLVYLVFEIQEFSLKYFLCASNPLDSSAPLQCPKFDCGGDSVTIDQLTNSIDLLKCKMGERANEFSGLQEEVTSAAAVPLGLLTTYFSIIGIPVFQGNYVTSWYQEAETYRLLNNFMTTLIIGTNAVTVIADYVKNNMLSFYLPLGLLLRSFYFTRSVGAFLMALAIGLYFIYPILYIITDPGFVRPSFTAPPRPPELESPLCYPTLSTVTFAMSSSSVEAVATSGGSTLSVAQLKSEVSELYLSVFLHPFVVFAITIVFIRYLMNILGGETQDLLRAVGKVI
ncbi:hypothetical protein J4450_01790 [Candidatus Micrarchaeota archaeon]|nr:hypothetical protein [Candidatus Micrarchaeota archaeon]